MDGREGMASFYLNRGVSGSGSGSGSGSVSHPGLGSSGGGLHFPPGFKTPNPNMRIGSIGRGGGGGGSPFQMDHNPSPNFPHGLNMSSDTGGVAGGGVGSSGSGGLMSITNARNVDDSVAKKKRGRPRKYGGEVSHMGLALTPTSPSAGPVSPGSGTSTPKKNRGRPPGSGRKQRLADVGEWMSTSAGTAFTPHIIHVEIGEDVAEKLLLFAQQRPRALCVMSGNGSVSAVQLRQFATSEGTVTYEGRFEILSLTGSYLLSETGAPTKRTGGLSISICSPDGHVIGGALGGSLIASSLIQVVACSFLFGGNNSPKMNPRTETPLAEEKSTGIQLNDATSAPSQAIAWPEEESRDEMRNSHTDIDLTRG